MKLCSYCGTALEDNARFCSKCGQNQYQAPQYQMPQYPPMYGQPIYGTAPYAPPVWTIGLFNALGALLVYLMSIFVNSLLNHFGFGISYVLLNGILGVVYHAIYIGVTCIGFVIYNGKCGRDGHTEKKLSVLWVGLPWLIRIVINFLTGWIWNLLMPILLYEIALTAPGMWLNVLSFILDALNASLTWLFTGLILKAVLKNRH